MALVGFALCVSALLVYLDSQKVSTVKNIAGIPVSWRSNSSIKVRYNRISLIPIRYTKSTAIPVAYKNLSIIKVTYTGQDDQVTSDPRLKWVRVHSTTFRVQPRTKED